MKKPHTSSATPSVSVRCKLDEYSYSAAESLKPHMRPGGPVREAILLHLAQHPEGVSERALDMIALGACQPDQDAPTADDMRVILGHLAREQLLAAERNDLTGERCLFSPPARKAARLRRLHGFTLRAITQPVRRAA